MAATSFRCKKNIVDTFARDDDYVPTSNQFIAKYVQGRGNNLHLVKDYKGEEMLVSMPKKFRSLVWLSPGDAIVIDPVIEGKKVVGEIFCLLETKHVINLVHKKIWPNVPDSELTISRDAIMEFFQRPVAKKGFGSILGEDSGSELDYDSDCTTESDSNENSPVVLEDKDAKTGEDVEFLDVDVELDKE